jgi:hypothetical protein
MIMPDPFDSDPWDAIDEPTPRGARTRRDARLAAREGRVTVEIPPYVQQLPEWAARWGESAPPVETVLMWSDVDGGNLAIAICVDDDQWSTTVPGVKGGAISFASLARMIANNPCAVATGWADIPTVEARPRGRAAVKDWAAQFLAPQTPAVPAAADEPPAQGH